MRVDSRAESRGHAGRAMPVVGMVGGGQLARMTAQAAIGLGIEFRVLARHAGGQRGPGLRQDADRRLPVRAGRAGVRRGLRCGDVRPRARAGGAPGRARAAHGGAAGRPGAAVRPGQGARCGPGSATCLRSRSSAVRCPRYRPRVASPRTEVGESAPEPRRRLAGRAQGHLGRLRRPGCVDLRRRAGRRRGARARHRAARRGVRRRSTGSSRCWWPGRPRARERRTRSCRPCSRTGSAAR